MKKLLLVIILIFLVILLVSCTAGPNNMTNIPVNKPYIAGFWAGLWHGFIALFTFVISLFSDSVKMYEIHNSGSLYDFGYLLGSLWYGAVLFPK